MTESSTPSSPRRVGRLLLSIFWNRSERRVRALWRLLLQTGILVVILILVRLLASELLFPSVSEGVRHVVGPYLSGLTLLLGCWLGIVVVGRRLDKRRLSDYGFHLDRSWFLDLAFGLALGGVLMAGIFALEYAAGWIEVHDTLHTSYPTVPFWVSIAGMLVLLVAVGIGEELIVRGCYLTNIAEGLTGRWIRPALAVLIAWIVSSAIFGVGHVFNPNTTLLSTLMILVAGLLLGLSYLLTGELAIPIGLHITWNFFQGVVFGFSVSGHRSKTSVVAITQGGSELWTGGRFGPEAGLVGLGAMLAGAGAIVLWVRWRRGVLTLHGPQRSTAAGTPSCEGVDAAVHESLS